MFIGNIGQEHQSDRTSGDGERRTESSAFSAPTQTGRFDSSGPTGRLKDIEAFKDSTVVDTVNGEFAGAYSPYSPALDKNGNAKE